MLPNFDYAALLTELRSVRFRELRPAQRLVLERYSADFYARADVGVELPTGAGKTLIALLISEACRRAGHKAAILTGNKTLARQLQQEATALGVPIVRMEGSGAAIPAMDKRAYHRARSIAVMNYWVYFNQNPAVDSANLLVMDDAHLTEHCLDSLYSMSVNKYDHPTLFETLVSELATRFPDYMVLQDALDPDAQPRAIAELLSFLVQDAALQRIREICDTAPDMAQNVDLRFRWGRLRNQLETVHIYASNRTLWFRPYIYPTRENEHYAATSQRLYMSATIGDAADLSRRLGVGTICKIPLARDEAEATYGRRLLVMNRAESGDLADRVQHAILAALRVQPKSVWLCASVADATRFREAVTHWLNSTEFVNQPTWLLTSLGDEIDEFKRSPAGHLFVGGRFDGMDFRADECRLVVLATIPRAINLQEEFITAYLRDSRFMLRRLNHRLTQALGRCNRSNDDYAVYVLADRRFATHFGRESNRLGVPRNIMAEVDLAEDLAERPIAEVEDEITRFLLRDFDNFDRLLAYRQAELDAPQAEPPAAADTAEQEVIGWVELFERQNFTAARERFQECAENANRAGQRDLSAYQLYCAAKAMFLEGRRGDPIAGRQAIDVLNNAIDRGGITSWFNRLRASVNRHERNQGRAEAVGPALDYADAVLHAFDERLEQWGAGTRFQRWIERVRAMLASTDHAPFQEGTEELGRALGYAAMRPRYQAATDCRWRGVFGNTREVITFEAKIEHVPDNTLHARDVGQAQNQYQRAFGQFDRIGYVVRGTIVTHLTEIAPEARASLGTIRIIPKAAVTRLFEMTMEILSDYRNGWSLEDLEARAVSAERVRPRFPAAGWLSRALAADDLIITDEALLREWQQH